MVERFYFCTRFRNDAGGCVSEGSVWIYGREVPGPRKSPQVGAGDLWMTGKDTKDVVQEHIVIIMWSTSKDTILPS